MSRCPVTALFVVLPTVVADVAENIELILASVSTGTTPDVVDVDVDVDGIG